MADNNLNDPSGIGHAVLGGVLAALGQWLWKRIARSPRPPVDGHSYAYISKQIQIILENQETQRATLEDLVEWKLRVEHRVRPASGAD